MEVDVDAVVDSTATAPNPKMQSAVISSPAAKRYTLASIQARQFGGAESIGDGGGKACRLRFHP